MFAGGISDKFGNIYEAKWTARTLIDVLRGGARSIRVEGISSEFQGFEFVVRYDDHEVWHQTKISTAQGNWTIRLLGREGVLGAILKRILANSANRCVFLTQSAINPLASLSSKAKTAADFQDFTAALGQDATGQFADLCTVVAANEPDAFELLRRTEFRTLPESEIDATIATLGEVLFAADTNDIFGELRRFLEARMNREITSESIREEIERDTGLRLKDWALAPTLRQKLLQQTKDYLSSYAPFGTGGLTINRSQTQEVVGHLLAASPKTVLLSGVAGAGKSGTVRGVIEELTRQGITHLAFRVDHYLEAKAPSDFGRAVLHREESPITTLQGVEPDRRTVLIVDQIDAVSEVSGRNGAAKNAVLRMVEEAQAFEAVSLLLICRSFDIESDDRLKALQQSSELVKVEVPLLDWTAEVVPLLTQLNVDHGAFTAGQKQLLRLPINLAVFASIAAEGDASFATRKDLFDRLLERKQRAISVARPGVSWAVEAALSRLARWMSDRQRLSAPDGTLSDFPSAIDILQSEQLITRVSGTIGFFHESFFDYIFARTFSVSHQTVVDLLLAGEQHLFRRTQVRQILEHLRSADFGRYIEELEGLLFDGRIRLHIRVAVAQWMATLSTPTEAERDLLLRLDDPTKPLPLLVRTVIAPSGRWFPILHKMSWPAEQLRSDVPERRNMVLWWLSKAVEDQSLAVVELLSHWWGTDLQRGDQLLDWFGTARPPASAEVLVTFFERLVASHPPSLFAREQSGRRHFLFARWVGQGDTASSSRAVAALFDAWFELNPGRHPFGRDDLKGMDLHALGELSKNSPSAFVEGMAPTFERAFAMMAATDAKKRDYALTIRMRGGDYGANKLLSLFRESLRSVAKSDPQMARALLGRLTPTLHEAAMHLHLETISANGASFADMLPQLVRSPLVFEAGWNGADWLSLAVATQAALPHLQPDGRDEVLAAVLRHNPELDYAAEVARDAAIGREHESQFRGREVAIHSLRRSGYEQYCILQTIGSNLLPPKVAAALAVLDRKFRHSGVAKPDIAEARFVESPIDQKNASHMTDEQWLSAIEKYNGSEDRSFRSFVGGAIQLSQILQVQTKLSPARFGRLLLRIPDTAHPSYASSILSGIAQADTIEDQVAKAAIKYAHALPKHLHGSQIARLIEAHPDVAAEGDILEVLLWYAANGEANEDGASDAGHVERETVTIEALLHLGGELHIRGINGARGQAMEALGAILWKHKQHAARAWQFLAVRAEEETLLSVRCCMVRAITALFNGDNRKSALLLEKLVDHPSLPPARFKTAVFFLFPHERAPALVAKTSVGAGLLLRPKRASDSTGWVSPLVTHAGTSLLPYVIWHVPDVGKRLLVRLLLTGDSSMGLIASWHVVRASYGLKMYGPLADILEIASLDAKRLAADIAAVAVSEAELRQRAKNNLIRYFDHADRQVQSQAAEVFRQIPDDQFDSFSEIADAFVMSRAYLHASFAFLHCLEKANSDVSGYVATAAERAIYQLKLPAKQRGTHDMEIYQIKDLILREYAASEGKPDVRKRMLDIIDDMHALELSGVEEITSAHER